MFEGFKKAVVDVAEKIPYVKDYLKGRERDRHAMEYKNSLVDEKYINEGGERHKQNLVEFISLVFPELGITNENILDVLTKRGITKGDILEILEIVSDQTQYGIRKDWMSPKARAKFEQK